MYMYREEILAVLQWTISFVSNIPIDRSYTFLSDHNRDPNLPIISPTLLPLPLPLRPPPRLPHLHLLAACFLFAAPRLILDHRHFASFPSTMLLWWLRLSRPRNSPPPSQPCTLDTSFPSKRGIDSLCTCRELEPRIRALGNADPGDFAPQRNAHSLNP